MTEPKPYEIKVTSDPVTEEDRAQRWAPALHVEIRPHTPEAHTDIGKVNCAPQRRITGGFYTQKEVDDILSRDPLWITERLEYAQRNLPSKGYGRYEVANHPVKHELEDPNHKIVGTFDAPIDMIHQVICSCGWSGPDKEFKAHNKEK